MNYTACCVIHTPNLGRYEASLEAGHRRVKPLTMEHTASGVTGALHNLLGYCNFTTQVTNTNFLL